MMRVPIPIRLLLINLCLVLSACLPKQTTVQLKVEAKDDHNNPIPNANILLNGDHIGTTDEGGRFNSTLQLKQNSIATIEVKKLEASSYYSPYFESFKTNDSTEKEMTISALLFSVPKASIKKWPESQQTVQEAKPETNSQTELPAVTQNTTPRLVTANTPIVAYPITDITPPTEKISPSLNLTPTEKPVTITIHTFSGNETVKNVKIYWGDEKNSRLIELCETNQRGRCIISLPTKPNGPITIVAERSGFQTLTITSHINAGNNLRLNLTQGTSLDIFAIEKYRNRTRGLGGVEVSIKGSPQGVTDKFGHFSYHFKGQRGETFPVDLKASDYLPEEQSADFTVGERLTMVKYFTPTRIPPFKVAVLDLGSKSASNIHQLVVRVRETLKEIPSVKEIKTQQLNPMLDKQKLSQQSLLNGWDKTELSESLDAILLVASGSESNFDECILLNNKGRVIQAAIIDGKPSNKEDVSSLLTDALDQIFTATATEGSIIDEENGVYQVNLGHKNSLVKMGTLLKVSSSLPSNDKNGSSAVPSSLKIVDVKPTYSKAKLVTEPNKSTIEIGDRVTVNTILSLEKEKSSKPIKFRISTLIKDKESPVVDANVYINKMWVGTSNEEGGLDALLNSTQESSIVITKPGYATFQNTLASPFENEIKFNLIPGKINLAIDSLPTGVPLEVNGQALGNTPFDGQIANIGGPVNIKLTPASEFQSSEISVSPLFGIIDLSTKSAIVLPSDPLARFKKAIAAHDIDSALQEANALPTNSNAFATTHQIIGHYLLTVANDPTGAAENYQLSLQSTAKEKEAPLAFASYHINLGIAYFMAGEKFLTDNDQKSALAYFNKAEDTISQALKTLQNATTQENLLVPKHAKFYQAMAVYRKGNIENSPTIIHQAGESFSEILQNPSLGSAADAYFKQTAQALLPLTKLSLNGISDPKTF